MTNKPDGGTSPMTAFGIPNANFGTNFTSGLGEFDMSTLSNFGDGLGVGRCNCPLIEKERQYQFVANMTKMRGNHQFKFGADVRYATNLRVPSDSNRTGVYAFNTNGTASNGVGGGLDLATFLLGEVTNLSRYVSTSTTAAERQPRMFYYGQDTWRVTPKLTLNYGLRWEVYFPEHVNGNQQGGFSNLVDGYDRVAGVGGIGLNGSIKNDWHYFAPRLGAAYQINEKTVVRMGYGRSYDMGVFGSNFGHAVTQNLPVLASQLVQGPTSTFTPAFTLDAGPPIFTFPSVPSNGLLPVAGPACYQYSTLGADGSGGPSGQNCTQPHVRPTFQRLPYLDAWNATIQRQLDRSTSLEVAYIGNKGTHGFAGDGNTYNVNQPSVVGYGTIPQTYRRPLYNHFTYTGTSDLTNTLANCYITSGDPGGPTCLAPNLVPGTLQCCSTDQGNYLGNDASSIYNALQIKVDRRFTKGLQFLTHYTFAHADKYDSNYYDISHPIAYGPSDQVRTHVWVTSFVYELPFGKGKSFAGNSNKLADEIIGGWQVTGTTNWSGGLPWTPSFAECGAEEDVGVCRPNYVGGFHTGAGSLQHTSTGQPYVQFFNPVANITTTPGPFGDPGVGNLGNVGVNSFRGPRAFFADAAAMKNFSITERVKAQFRADIFNVFNHPVLGFNGNQGGTGQCIDCAGQGQINSIEADSSPGSTTGMRQIEFALKFSF